MNRWRARLAELQSDAFALPAQNVQIVQKPSVLPTSEHFEHFEQQPEPVPVAQNDTWTDAEEERAAVAEFDGGAPHPWAEGFAHLDCSHPPADVPFRRWHQFIDDCGLFLDNGWAAKAAALGWGPSELFGADGRAPFGRVDRAGLLWLLNGNRLVALTADTAIIETATGARQTYYRTPVESEQIALAWELSG